MKSIQLNLLESDTKFILEALSVLEESGNLFVRRREMKMKLPNMEMISFLCGSSLKKPRKQQLIHSVKTF